MEIEVKRLSISNTEAWDKYVYGNDNATVYHLSGWSRIIEKTYGHKPYLLAALKINGGSIQDKERPYEVVGILPIVKHRNIKFVTSLISMPFCDLGGVVANDEEIHRRLVLEAIILADKIGATQIELRNRQKQKNIENLTKIHSKDNLYYSEENRRVRMVLKLPLSSRVLIDGFKSKLRSQIKKPLKCGFTAKVGKLELLEDFYKVFVSNMRDLGSPVHSKRLFLNIFKEFDDKANIFIVSNNKGSLAGSITFGYRGIMYNPWASSLRKYSKYSPNMLLYWKMLEYACDNGYGYFDFGRSSIDEGTYRFKKQWGAEPEALPWQYISCKKSRSVDSISESRAFQAAGEFWKRLPLNLTKIIGPHLRKYIGL